MINDLMCDRVQLNCNIADAKHAANYTLCTYLMKMREFCRWDKGYSYSDTLQKEEVGNWVSTREALWETLEEDEYHWIEIDGQKFSPFDTQAINNLLLPKQWVYSGGLGARSVPHFFLGKLEDVQDHEDYQIIISDEECARDLSAPPAMTLGQTIFIRKESVRRMLWEKVQEWRWSSLDNPMSKALSYYDFDHDVEKALDAMVEEEVSAILWHEKGEIETSRILTEQWKQCVAKTKSARLELMLRTVKDLFADAKVTIPSLISHKKAASIHFFAGNMSPMRKQLCPSFINNYHRWAKDEEDYAELNRWAERSDEHWFNVLSRVLSMYEEQKTEADISKYIEAQVL